DRQYRFHYVRRRCILSSSDSSAWSGARSERRLRAIPSWILQANYLLKKSGGREGPPRRLNSSTRSKAEFACGTRTDGCNPERRGSSRKKTTALRMNTIVWKIGSACARPFDRTFCAREHANHA